MKRDFPPMLRHCAPLQILESIKESETQLNRHEIAESLGKPESTFRRAVYLLKLRGLIREVLVITDEGQRLLEEMKFRDDINRAQPTSRDRWPGLGRNQGGRIYPVASSDDEIAEIERQAREARPLAESINVGGDAQN